MSSTMVGVDGVVRWKRDGARFWEGVRRRRRRESEEVKEKNQKRNPRFSPTEPWELCIIKVEGSIRPNGRGAGGADDDCANFTCCGHQLTLGR